jgi:hypothetical protein
MQFVSGGFVVERIVHRAKPEVLDTEWIDFRVAIGRIIVSRDFRVIIVGVMGISVRFR